MVRVARKLVLAPSFLAGIGHEVMPGAAVAFGVVLFVFSSVTLIDLAGSQPSTGQRLSR